MGFMGRYIDSLPDAAKDRIIEAQNWCVADVLAPGGARCLVGHAEDWVPLEIRPPWWRRWMDSETGGLEMTGGPAASEHEVGPMSTPDFFAFRRAYPADMGVYLQRIQRWGVCSESRIGARFDRLCGRGGVAAANRLIKARAARGGITPVPLATPPPGQRDIARPDASADAAL
jgi:hypothetical protein